MTDGDQDDTRLIAALDDVIEGSKTMTQGVNERIIEAMESHPKFRNGSIRIFGPKVLERNSYWQARNLFKVAVERGPSAAVAWCHKVYSTERADLRYVSVVSGLHLDQPLTLSNGVSLMPLAKLPASVNAAEVANQFQVVILAPKFEQTMSAPIGATLEVKEVVSSYEGSRTPVEMLTQPSDVMERTIKAFTLLDGAAPVIARWWVEFVDTELAMTEWSSTCLISGDTPSHISRDVDTDAIEWVERYIHLASDARSSCDVAIERLNLARRRRSPGDKAIEGAICLEALLGDLRGQEISYKLRLRSALLLSTELDERRKISNAVKDFYTLRSNTVHGTAPKLQDAEKNYVCAERGLDICAQALRKIVRDRLKVGGVMRRDVAGRASIGRDQCGLVRMFRS